MLILVLRISGRSRALATMIASPSPAISATTEERKKEKASPQRFTLATPYEEDDITREGGYSSAQGFRCYTLGERGFPTETRREKGVCFPGGGVERAGVMIREGVVAEDFRGGVLRKWEVGRHELVQAMQQLEKSITVYRGTSDEKP